MNNLASHVAKAQLDSLGAMIEYSWLRRKLSLPSLNDAIGTPLSDRFHAFSRSEPANTSNSLNDGSQFDFIRIPTCETDILSPVWTTFKSRMMFAGESHGFSKQQAAGLVGALGEMASNSIEHSQHPSSAIAAFNSSQNVFEFVVADAGIGATASIHGCEDYRHIHDPGDALKLCISEGVSRHGRAGMRGLGFQVLFSRLSDLNARVRIRSDDQVIDLRGDRLGPKKAIPAGRVPIKGMLISVQCFPSA